MNRYRIADAHAHIFPTKIADKAVASIGNFYGIDMYGQGVADALLHSGQDIGVEKYLVCSTATRPEQVEAINSFIAETCAEHEEFFGFATMHPNYNNISEELERVAALGLRGIKLHPDFQEFDIDCSGAMKMYREIEKAGLAVLFHCGDQRYDYSAPQRLGRVAEAFPEMTCIAAHFGGYNRWQDAVQYLGQPNVWYDTSSTLFALPPEDAVQIIRHFGEDRFMFGTDYPMWNHKQELERFMTMQLSEEQRKKILWDNFARLFGL